MSRFKTVNWLLNVPFIPSVWTVVRSVQKHHTFEMLPAFLTTQSCIKLVLYSSLIKKLMDGKVSTPSLPVSGAKSIFDSSAITKQHSFVVTVRASADKDNKPLSRWQMSSTHTSRCYYSKLFGFEPRPSNPLSLCRSELKKHILHAHVCVWCLHVYG